MNTHLLDKPLSLQESLLALEGHDEFAIKQYDGLVCLDYIVCFPGTFDYTETEIRDRAYFLWEQAGRPESDGREFWLQAEQDCKRFAWIRRNCRGVTFDDRSGDVVSLPLHKFFNLNQTEETQFHVLRDRRATIYEKLDGSMIHFFKHPVRGELQAATCRSTQTPQAQESLLLAQKDAALEERIWASVENGWTPIFEFVAAHNQIVVQYPRRRLVYLISRNRTTGEYRFDDTFHDKAERFEFNFADIFSYLDREEFEGYVCHLDNGMLVKAKTPWYLERHRAVDALMRPAYKLYEIVFAGIMDDMLPTAPDRYKPVLTAIYEEAQRDLLHEKRRLESIFEECSQRLGVPPDLAARKEDRLLRKAFVEHLQKSYQGDFHPLMQMYSGRDPSANIKERLMEGYRVKYPNRLFADMEVDP